MSHLIGTAGHVDHGKTTLIQALTGIDADRLPEEKARGLTIDIGFAFIDFPSLGRVSIVDVPGHERFLRNMLVGALGVDVALLCIAADEGVKPQTREHFQILEVLPVERMVVALTRADLAGEETLTLSRLDVESLLEGTRFAGSPIVSVSAVNGSGLDELRSLLEAALMDSKLERPGAWYLPIDRAFSVKGQGAVVTGTLARGSVSVGATAILSPGAEEVRVRAIHVHGDAAESADFGKRVALNLGGVKLEELHRGQVVSAPGAVFETSILDAEMRWIVPPKHSQRVRVSIGSEEAIGRVFLNNQRPELVQIRLESVIACAREQPLILRQYSPPVLLGGGKVLVPQAAKRRKNETALVAEGHAGYPEAEILLSLLSTAQNGMLTEELCRLAGRTRQELGDVLEQLSEDKLAFGFGGLWFAPEAFAFGRDRFLAELDALHNYQPMKLWQPRETVLRKAELNWAGKPLQRILSYLENEGDLRLDGTMVKLAGFRVQLSDKQRAFLDRVVLALDAGGINSPSPLDVARSLSVPPQAVEEILKLGFEAGELARLPEGIWYSQSQIDRIKASVAEMFGVKPFTAAEFRDRSGTSRKYAIPLLEYLDSVGFTARRGDSRFVE